MWLRSRICIHTLAFFFKFNLYKFLQISYIIDTTKSPIFELLYIWFTIDIFITLAIYLTTDLFFIGISLYTVAMYDELQHMVRVVSVHNNNLRKCISFHNDILRYNQTFRTMNRIIVGLVLSNQEMRFSAV